MTISVSGEEESSPQPKVTNSCKIHLSDSIFIFCGSDHLKIRYEGKWGRMIRTMMII